MLSVLLFWCFSILKPFLSIIVGGTVIAIAVYPIYCFFKKVFRGSRLIASAVLLVIMLSIIIIPSLIITDSLINGTRHIRELYQQGQPLIPPPGEAVKNWPVIAKPIVDLWSLASENMLKVTTQYKDQLETAAGWLFSALAGIGKSVMVFAGSILVSVFLLIFSEKLIDPMLSVFNKLAGTNGELFASISVLTVRNVFKSVLGVAFLQATLASIGFFVAGVPFAGLWSVVCLFSGIVQLGVGPIGIPIAVYMFTATDTLTAVLFAIWMLIVTVSDNLIKPFILGRGAPVPMLVVFLGSIGGFIYSGFIGLFLGAIILSVGYRLFLLWLGKTENI